ncbi:MAG: hypothetical protein K2H80_01825, partial [Ureaplasma sp.]|nr:hypothetical protein [Ureaplasma sp.]
MKNNSILENYELIKNNKKTYQELVQEKIEKIKISLKNNENIIINTIFDESINKAKELDNSSSKTYSDGVIILVKDNIAITGIQNTSGSKILENYIAPYDATIIKKLKDKNAIILATTNLDEFGEGGTGTSSGFGIVKNPSDPTRIVGGSSSGSTAAVKLGYCDIAIGTDTGDSIRHPCSFAGTTGYKPSFGIISTYGVCPYASSLDHVGIISNHVQDCAIGTDLIAGYDKDDLKTIKSANYEFNKNLKVVNKAKIVIFKDVNDGMSNNVKSIFNSFINDLKNKYEIIEINFGQELLDILLPIYKTISFLEAASNRMNLNGITFAGKNINYKNYEDLMVKVRENFTDEVKQRYLAFAKLYDEDKFDVIYHNSLKIRNIITNKINKILSEYDYLIIPSASDYPPLIEDVLAGKPSGNFCDDALLLANFAHLPSLTVPITNPDNKLHFGINIISKYAHVGKIWTNSRTLIINPY